MALFNLFSNSMQSVSESYNLRILILFGNASIMEEGKVWLGVRIFATWIFMGFRDLYRHSF